ncbi:YegS/Rv2252/BmrU family lipid kinase [Bacillus velezensis]|nr:YegS/Rv2252/BmrU family lipid kinase [Bacillus velezensis]
MKRARIIYNPTSGRELLRKILPRSCKNLNKPVMKPLPMPPHARGCHQRRKEAALREFDLIIATGGDGTINEVVNGLAPLDKRPTLGIIPVGTTNDFARALGIPRENILNAADTVINGVARPIDIGQVNGQYFINIAGGGRLTELTYDVPSKLKTMLGQLAYYLKGMEIAFTSTDRSRD